MKKFGAIGLGDGPDSVFRNLNRYNESISLKKNYIFVGASPMSVRDLVRAVEAYDPKHPSYVEVNGRRRVLAKEVRELVDNIFRVAVNTQGPAVCVEFKGREKTVMKKKFNMAGRHGRLFYFFGTVEENISEKTA